MAWMQKVEDQKYFIKSNKKETESAVDDGKKKKEDPKAVKKVATPAKGLGKLAEASNLPSSTASAGKTKLRDRNGGPIQKDRSNAVGT